MNTIGEPNALQIGLKTEPLSRSLIALVIEVQRFTRTAHLQIVFAVLVKKNITAPESSFSQIIYECLLISSKALEIGHPIAENAQVSKLFNHIRKILR